VQDALSRNVQIISLSAGEVRGAATVKNSPPQGDPSLPPSLPLRCGLAEGTDMSAGDAAPPVQQCKGVNGLDKVVLREVRGCSAEVVYAASPSFPCPSLMRSVPTARSRRGSTALCVLEPI
jgi:hypothetical protein